MKNESKHKTRRLRKGKGQNGSIVVLLTISLYLHETKYQLIHFHRRQRTVNSPRDLHHCVRIKYRGDGAQGRTDREFGLKYCHKFLLLGRRTLYETQVTQLGSSMLR
jgi:hypothetical protein